MSAVFFVAVGVQTALFAAYRHYLNRLRDTGCLCALTPRFARIETLFVWVVALFYATLLCLFACRFVPADVCIALNVAGSLLAIALAVNVVRWCLDMRAAGCLCSDAWEKDLWAFLSAYHLAAIVLGAVGALLTLI